MSTQSPWSWRHAVIKSDLKPTTRHVLLTLSVYMSDAGEAVYPATKTLAENTGLSERAVCTHLELAAEAGWIKISVHGFGSRSWKRNQYEATWPADMEPGERSRGTERRSVPNADEALNVVPRGTERRSVESSKGTSPPIVPPKRLQPENELRDALQRVLDQEHADAVLADREAKGRPLTLDEAHVVARHCEAYSNPNTAAEALIATGYRGCRIGRLPTTAQAARSRRAGEEDGRAAGRKPGTIVFAEEPEAFAKAVELSGIRAAAGANSWVFQPELADAARAATTPAGERLRIVEPTP